MISVNDALRILYNNRNELTRQQIKTLAGQIKHGETVAAIKGMYKILDREDRKKQARGAYE